MYPIAPGCTVAAAMQLPPEQASAGAGALFGPACLVAGLGIATALADERRRRREEHQQQAALDALFGGTDLLDDEDDDAVRPEPAPPFDRRDALTPAAFRTGCDRLFSQGVGWVVPNVSAFGFTHAPGDGAPGNETSRDNSRWTQTSPTGSTKQAASTAVDTALPKATIRSVPPHDSVNSMPHTPPARKRELPPAKPRRGRNRLWAAVAGLLVLLGGGLMFRGAPSSWQEEAGPSVHRPAGNVNAATRTESAGAQPLDRQRIDTIRLGTRLRGRNPIREEVQLHEPDPATWRAISLYMTKESGLGLWIDLLRPVAWIEEHEAEPGGSIYLEMHEMGAVGEAEVVRIGPCPPIEPGDGGAVVTGRFKHEADASSGVVHLALEDQFEPTGVTDNHPYWSVDRREFVRVGQLRVGELVDTIHGPKRVVSVTPIDHNGFLYNLETTEHVYRVGSVGTLVHNACPIPRIPRKLTQAQRNAYRDGARTIWHARTGRRAIWDGMDVHHRIPLEWAHKFPRVDPNRTANLIGVHQLHHPTVNRAWSTFKAALNGRDPTAAQVMRMAMDIDIQYGHLFTFLP